MLATAVVLLSIWFVLTRSLDPAVIAVGVVAVAIVCLALRVLSLRPDRLVVPLLRHPVRAATYVAVLVGRFVESTTYTVRLILLGGEEGRIVALPLQLHDPIGQLVLLNSITLTPSTISLLVEGDLLYIHWLRAAHEKGDWQAIKESLERRLLLLFPGRDDDRH
jgi:multisubunit Na+/H+ antiporter MnhE subunit